MSAVIPPLFRANAQDDQSIAQMVALLDVQDGLPSASASMSGRSRQRWCDREIRWSISAAEPGR